MCGMRLERLENGVPRMEDEDGRCKENITRGEFDDTNIGVHWWDIRTLDHGLALMSIKVHKIEEIRA